MDTGDSPAVFPVTKLGVPDFTEGALNFSVIGRDQTLGSWIPLETTQWPTDVSIFLSLKSLMCVVPYVWHVFMFNLNLFMYRILIFEPFQCLSTEVGNCPFKVVRNSSPFQSKGQWCCIVSFTGPEFFYNVSYVSSSKRCKCPLCLILSLVKVPADI